MSLIQQLDRRSVHHIQSGQVINEGLTSAVKELVENALDANATSIEVRFKNYGLESIEVIDNGDGVAPENYESIALKHYTSKLRDYSDLDTVSTFGFRGEALSSLCALSDLTITTARACEAPKGVKLVFEGSGKLQSQSVVAASKGTSVCSANLFKTLPVRRKELERNIKREYAKVLGYLQAYACICVNVKFSVFNQMTKGKRTPAFATKGNPTTRENIINVFGSKSLAALVPLDLQFELKPTLKGALAKAAGARKESRTVKVLGHISRPVVGEGRNAPDRQMFFVNGRPCNLPQISKAINEVYKGFNVTQSPFIFADIQLDTDAYDVNVSPDKRTILLHDQADLLESLKNSLLDLFERQEQTVPVNQLGSSQRLKQLNIGAFSSLVRSKSAPSEPPSSAGALTDGPQNAPLTASYSHETQKGVAISKPFKPPSFVQPPGSSTPPAPSSPEPASLPMATRPFIGQTRQRSPSPEIVDEDPIPSSQIPSTQYPPTTRLPRKINASATITIGDRSPVISGPLPHNEYPQPSKRRKIDETSETKERRLKGFVGSLSKFRAPGTQASQSDLNSRDLRDEEENDEESEEDEIMDEVEEDVGPVPSQDTQRPIEKDLADDSKNDEEAPSPECDISYPNTCRTDGVEGPIFSDALVDHDNKSEPNEDENHEVAENQDERQIISSSPQRTLEEYDQEEDDSRSEMSKPKIITLDDDEDEDGDYLPPTQADAEARRRATRRLQEAETEAVSLPSSDMLARAATILRGSPTTSTYDLILPLPSSLSQIHSYSSRASSTPIPITQITTTASQDVTDDSDQAAETRLTLTISKSDFLRMHIKGQFNLGFILTTRADELFIIDQHASDEKYNFETLQQTTTVSPQPLAVPKQLELMAMDEIAVIANLDVFKKNGFIVKVNDDEMPGKKCRLMSVPMSKDTVFGMGDFEELVHLLHQNPGGNGVLVRPAKVRAMFAMRACRKSIMVGKALHKKQMERVVRHMGELDKPWNCPHGRPTMRHLGDLGTIDTWREYDGKLSWGEQWRRNKDRLRELMSDEEEGEEDEMAVDA
ncbi:DNA mismatch repair protein MutL [Ascodesmis nigricans]|uniref:DNA mismatch repair protein PMS1 n=1 Tax=Ascodesmis nigricans TaxID=341454 RepID=A0A4S2N943_9PEZI|nr:DNA mismatch repair protein MutL [Ascodesmis nigricans]